MTDRDRENIKEMVTNTIDFCGPPLTRARELIEGEDRVFTDEMEKYAMECIENYGKVTCIYCHTEYEVEELGFSDGGAICPHCGNTIDY